MNGRLRRPDEFSLLCTVLGGRSSARPARILPCAVLDGLISSSPFMVMKNLGRACYRGSQGKQGSSLKIFSLLSHFMSCPVIFARGEIFTIHYSLFTLHPSPFILTPLPLRSTSNIWSRAWLKGPDGRATGRGPGASGAFFRSPVRRRSGLPGKVLRSCGRSKSR